MKRLFLVLFACTFSAPAYAQDASSHFMAGVTGGSLGIGPELTYRVSEVIGLRANAAFFGFEHEVDSSDITYNGDLNLQSVGVMVDVHPFGGSFRISGGARIGDNKVELTAAPTGDVEIGDETYMAAQIGTLSGNVAANDFAPMVTLGWAGGLTRGVKLGLEAGAMFHGTPRINDLSATGSLANDPQFRESLLAEEAEIEGDIDNYKVYPIVQLSLAYAF